LEVLLSGYLEEQVPHTIKEEKLNSKFHRFNVNLLIILFLNIF